MKRATALVLLILMMFSVSCSAGGQNELFDIEYGSFGADESGIDLEGYEFHIRYYNLFASGDGDVFGYKLNSAFNDAARKRMADVEKTLNCVIHPDNTSNTHLEGNFTTMIISGMYFSDAIMTSSYNLRPQIESRMFEPLSRVSEIIDYHDSRKWGNWRILEQGVWDGEIYGVVPVQWPDTRMTLGFMFIFNEKFAGLLNQPDPREFVEDRTWSRDRLGEMMLAYTTNDLGHPLKSIILYEGHFYDTALRANNAQAYKYVDGEYVSGYHTPEGFEALRWADEFLHVLYPDCIVPSGNDNGAVFINEDVAMWFNPVSETLSSDARVLYEVDDFALLPMPNGPDREKETNKYTTFFEGVHDMVLFPVNGNIECSAYIADALYEPLDGFDETQVRDYYLRSLYHSETDYEAALEVFENSRYSFVSDGIRTLVVEALYGNHKKTVTEILESTEDAQNERVQKYLVPTASSLEGIFGADALQND